MEWMRELDSRQRQEAAFCNFYAQNFAHGTDGHHLRMLVARLSDLLDDAHYDIALLTEKIRTESD